MQIVTRRMVIADVRARWKRQYERYNWNHRFFGEGPSVGEISGALDSLDLATCSRSDVTKAMGTPSWTELVCDPCGRDVEILIRIGEEPEYEARWQNICHDCLAAAQKLLSGARP